MIGLYISIFVFALSTYLLMDSLFPEEAGIGMLFQ